MTTRQDAPAPTGAGRGLVPPYLPPEEKEDDQSPPPPAASKEDSAPAVEKMTWTRHAPEGVDVPRRLGRQWFKYLLWRLYLIGVENQPPKPGKKEQAKLKVIHALEHREQRREQLTQQIELRTKPRRMLVDDVMLAWPGIRLDIATLQCKSAAKSTSIANLTARLATIARGGSCLWIPATTVPGDGAMRSGASPKDTITLSQLFDLLPGLQNGSITTTMLQQMIACNEYGVYVVAPDFQESEARGMKDYLDLITELRKHFQFIFMDGGNQLRSFEKAAAMLADQVFFPIYTGTVSTPHMLGQTMDAYAADRALRADKVVENSIVVVSGLKPDQELHRDYVRYAHYTYVTDGDGAEQAVSQRRFKGKVMAVRWEPAINDRMFCRIEDQSPDVDLDYLELLYRLIEDAMRKRTVDTTVLERILEAERALDTSIPFIEDLQGGGDTESSTEDIVDGEPPVDDVSAAETSTDTVSVNSGTGWPGSSREGASGTGWPGHTRELDPARPLAPNGAGPHQ